MSNEEKFGAMTCKNMDTDIAMIMLRSASEYAEQVSVHSSIASNVLTSALQPTQSGPCINSSDKTQV